MSSGCRILIVDDDRTAREALAKVLSLLGYATCTAQTIRDAQQMLDGQTHVVLDLRLGDGNGTEILRRIREEGRAIKVAVVSSEDDSPLMQAAQALGPDVIYHKPANLDALLAWIRATTPHTADGRSDSSSR